MDPFKRSQLFKISKPAPNSNAENIKIKKVKDKKFKSLYKQPNTKNKIYSVIHTNSVKNKIFKAE